MTVPNELKLNKFVDVHIPTNSELMKRLGECTGTNKYTGDEHATGYQSKIDMLTAGAEQIAQIEDLPE